MMDKRKIILGGQTVWFTLKRSSGARHVRFEVRQDTGLIAVIPKSYRVEQIPSLLQAKRHWILEKLATVGAVQSPSVKRDLKTGDVIPYLGGNLEVVKSDNQSGVHDVKRQGSKLIVGVKSPSSRASLAVEHWYQLEAMRVIKERVDKLSGRLGVTYNWVTVRGQKTRWASCSQKGRLSFNWKLIMAPKPVIDYVIIHELTHLKEMNHSKQFWELVAKHCPRWREHKKWLKDHETDLAAKLPL